MDKGKSAFAKIKKAKEMNALLLLPKKKILEKSCDDIHYAKPKFKIGDKIFGRKIFSAETERLCNQHKIEAERDYNTLNLSYTIIVECENKLNSLIHGPACISSPAIFQKSLCSNWREFIIMPDEEHNPEWHAELESLIQLYEININILIQKLSDNKYNAIPQLLGEMKANADKIYNTIQGIEVIDALVKETNDYGENNEMLEGLAKKDMIKISAGLPG